MRARSLFLLLLSVGFVVPLLAGGCAGQAPMAQSDAQPSPPSWLTAMACKVATGLEDPHPSLAQYVKSRHAQAEQAASGDIVHDRKNVPVYLVVLTGHFIARDVSHPGGVTGWKPPRGSVATFTVTLGSHDVLDGGIQDRMPDLSPLGTPHPLGTVCG